MSVFPCGALKMTDLKEKLSISPLSKMLAKAVAIPVNSNQFKGIS